MSSLGCSETEPGVEWCVDGQGATTRYFECSQPACAASQNVCLFSMLLCPHAGRAHPFSSHNIFDFIRYSMELAHNDSPVYKDFYMLVSLIKRMQKSCQSYPSPRLRIFSFRRTTPDTRQKSFPPTPARTTLTACASFASGEVGDLRIDTFPLCSICWFFEKSPVQVRIKTHRVGYKGSMNQGRPDTYSLRLVAFLLF